MNIIRLRFIFYNWSQDRDLISSPGGSSSHRGVQLLLLLFVRSSVIYFSMHYIVLSTTVNNILYYYNIMVLTPRFGSLNHVIGVHIIIAVSICHSRQSSPSLDQVQFVWPNYCRQLNYIETHDDDTILLKFVQ